MDPPRGGFPSSGADEDDAIWSDNIPWYHDEMLPPGKKNDPHDPVTAEGNVSADGNSIGYYDDPHFDEKTRPGAEIRFKTWLVLVKSSKAGIEEAYRPLAFLGGFRWKVAKNASGGRTTEILHRTDPECPGEADYEQLLNQPNVPGVPRWFDTHPRHFAPDSSAESRSPPSIGIPAVFDRDAGSSISFNLTFPDEVDVHSVSTVLARIPVNAEIWASDPDHGDCIREVRRTEGGYATKLGCHGASGTWYNAGVQEAARWLLPAILPASSWPSGVNAILMVPKLKNRASRSRAHA